MIDTNAVILQGNHCRTALSIDKDSSTLNIVMHDKTVETSLLFNEQDVRAIQIACTRYLNYLREAKNAQSN